MSDKRLFCDTLIISLPGPNKTLVYLKKIWDSQMRTFLGMLCCYGSFRSKRLVLLRRRLQPWCIFFLNWFVFVQIFSCQILLLKFKFLLQFSNGFSSNYILVNDLARKFYSKSLFRTNSVQGSFI